MTLLSARDHVVVVGGGLAGWRVCEGLRRQGFAGRLTLIGDEPHAPYDRPPLSKQVMSGKWPFEHTTLATPQKIQSTGVDLRLGVRARHLDPSTATLTLDDESVVSGSHVVIATGARARRLAWHDAREFEVRSLEDARRLVQRLEQLSPGDPVAIVGAGFIGAEVATSLKARGLRPVVLEAAARPLVNVLGEDVSNWLESLPAQHGVEVRTSQKVTGAQHFEDGDADILFEDGSRLRARAVVVGVGAQPNVEWLEGSGLELDNGVVVDGNQLCTAHVAAVGDVASFPGLDGRRARIEHWQVANDHAAALARHWMTGEESGVLIPYFWSDQYGQKIQMLGHPRPDDDVSRVKDAGPDKWLALYSRGGVVSGAVALNQPRALMLSKGLLERRTTFQEAQSAAPWR